MNGSPRWGWGSRRPPDASRRRQDTLCHTTSHHVAARHATRLPQNPPTSPTDPTKRSISTQARLLFHDMWRQGVCGCVCVCGWVGGRTLPPRLEAQGPGWTRRLEAQGPGWTRRAHRPQSCRCAPDSAEREVLGRTQTPPPPTPPPLATLGFPHARSSPPPEGSQGCCHGVPGATSGGGPYPHGEP